MKSISVKHGNICYESRYKKVLGWPFWAKESQPGFLNQGHNDRRKPLWDGQEKRHFRQGEACLFILVTVLFLVALDKSVSHV